MLCSSCYYLMTGQQSPTGHKWCGWMGGNPTPGNPNRCRPMPLKQQRVPEGLVIARSSRVVPVAELANENAVHGDQVGESGYQSF
ncbi:MAG: hypothetical protein WD940_02355 [Patescibacteria group bacterium]